MKTIPEISMETRMLRDKLSALKIGDVITYGAVAKIVGRPVDGSFGPLLSALRRARKNEGMEFGSITGVGYLTEYAIEQSVAGTWKPGARGR